MFSFMRTSLRFFIIGFVAGTLFAPRPGTETRRMLAEKARVMANQLLELAALPPIESERASANGGDAPRAKRSTGPRGTSARSES
jgi:hypothetical protein